MQACLFGSIISATDPVAVVSILKTLGNIFHQHQLYNLPSSSSDLVYSTRRQFYPTFSIQVLQNHCLS